ncbi:hypothetical protein [Burkholderia ubonensis]|uniref:hypothetical protein n=1 Tax=Burkholderia ubonensis TaxID=101571 RepID=UPI00075EF908|nr:hypothetical protein [Burkholderia ubonensis]KVP75513.1 hypothetical protein WJ93_09135 [Burkholderia ubonensis]
MKKTLLTLALLAAAAGAHATSQPVKAAVPAPVAAGVPAAAAASAVAAPAAVENATVSVTGASTVAGAPLLLSLDGSKPADPSFKDLFDAAQAHPKWKVTQVKSEPVKSRLLLKSVTGTATLEMDVATSLVGDLKVKKDSIIEVETQSSGQGALIKFVKDKTPLGFMVNKNTSVIQQK